MVKSIVDKNKDPAAVLKQVISSQVEFTTKIQKFRDNLNALLPALTVGMTLEALEDCMNNFHKGQKVEITKVTEDGAMLDGVADIEEKWIRKYFKIVGTA